MSDDTSTETVREQLKTLLIAELNLEDKQPGDIIDDEPLFGGGLGLDSLDALQLAMSIEETFGVQIPEDEESRSIFTSVDTLVAHIELVQAKKAE